MENESHSPIFTVTAITRAWKVVRTITGEGHELCQLTISWLTWPRSTCSDMERQVNGLVTESR